MRQRLQIVQGETSVPVIEQKVGCGQIEELIDQVSRHSKRTSRKTSRITDEGWYSQKQLYDPVEQENKE